MKKRADIYILYEKRERDNMCGRAKIYEQYSYRSRKSSEAKKIDWQKIFYTHKVLGVIYTVSIRQLIHSLSFSLSFYFENVWWSPRLTNQPFNTLHLHNKYKYIYEYECVHISFYYGAKERKKYREKVYTSI